MSNLLRNHDTVFHNGHTILYYNHYCTFVYIQLSTICLQFVFQFVYILFNICYFLVFFVVIYFLTIAILVALKCYLIEVLVCIFLITSDLEHLFMSFAIVSLFREMSIKVICPFFSQDYCLLLLDI